MATETTQFIAHAKLPLPAQLKHLNSTLNPGVDQKLLEFIRLYGNSSSKFTIDGKVGKGVLCAFIQGPSSIKTTMSYSTKEQIQDLMVKQGYQCSVLEGSTLVNCVKKEASTLAKL